MVSPRLFRMLSGCTRRGEDHQYGIDHCAAGAHSAETGIRSRNQEFWSYLSEHWLTDLIAWTKRARKHAMTFGNETTNRVESANRHIKWKLTESSSLFTCVQAIINRNQPLEAKCRRLVSFPLMRGQPEGATVTSHLGCLGRLTPCARERVSRNHKKSVELVHNTQSYLVFRDSNQVQLGEPMKCSCSFTSSWLLSCRHMACAAEYHGQSLISLVESCKWFLPLNDIQPSATVAENSVSVPAAPKGKSSKVSVARNISSDICEAMVLGSSDFDAFCRFLRTFADWVCAGHVPICVSEGVTGTSRVELLKVASKRLAASGEGVPLLALKAPVMCNDQPSTSNASTHRRARKSPLPFYEEKVTGLDETFYLQDDDYHLQCIKIRDHKVRTAAKYNTAAMHRKRQPLVSHADADV
ncbi:hypothetical protein CLF_113140 [Clonorchis sinensis]|uniref:SWIM-type domain-containing protein n=1 Tax=Clonorchis sinensis TaxID=79923 RepID=G7YXQ8_CLOSI|nr:hypothetical protein CLF_113140 [Clonorchis sinensis]